MKDIKFIVVCKKGYIFASNKDEVIDFIDRFGTEIAYYIGHFNPVTDFNDFFDIDTNIENLIVEDEHE